MTMMNNIIFNYCILILNLLKDQENLLSDTQSLSRFQKFATIELTRSL